MAHWLRQGSAEVTLLLTKLARRKKSRVKKNYYFGHHVIAVGYHHPVRCCRFSTGPMHMPDVSSPSRSSTLAYQPLWFYLCEPLCEFAILRCRKAAECLSTASPFVQHIIRRWRRSSGRRADRRPPRCRLRRVGGSGRKPDTHSLSTSHKLCPISPVVNAAIV